MTMCRFRPRTNFPPSTPTSARPWAVLADGESMHAPLRVGSRPDLVRTSTRRAVTILSQVPSRSNARRDLYTVFQCGKSCNEARQLHPSRLTYRSALTTSRMSYLRGRPPAFTGGIKRATSFHWVFVRSPV